MTTSTFHVTAWVNFPKQLVRDLNSRDEEKVVAALCRIIVSHDLVDEESAPYPPASGPAFWEIISNDVGKPMVDAVMDQIGKLDPKPR